MTAIPFQDVSLPTTPGAAPKEVMGFDLYCPAEISNPPIETLDDLDQDFVDDSNQQDDDENNNYFRDADELAAENESIRAFVNANLPAILNHWRVARKETTMEAFERQTGGNIWIPFSTDLNSSSEVDVEERQVFNAMAQLYNRNVAPSAPNGYNLFQKAWNQNAGHRHVQSLDGDESIVLLRYKSVAQLQSYYDYLRRMEQQSHDVTDTDDANRHSMFAILRSGRENAIGQALNVPTAPIAYTAGGDWATVPFGAPVVHPYLYQHTFSRQQSTANYAPFVMNAPLPT